MIKVVTRGCGGLLALALALVLAGPGDTLAEENPLDAVVGVRAEIPADARTADALGTQREGSGVVIGPDGLVLTIGYLILEATSAEITLQDDRKVPAEIVAYDYETGFGLLRPLDKLGLPAIQLGSSDGLDRDNPVMIASYGGKGATYPEATAAYVVSRREFAGYWEYLLPDAIFTAPPHLGFGGAALIGRDGRLVGIGSLFVSDAADLEMQLAGNMFVPIDALKPILSELLAKGRADRTTRPWLGVFTEELRGRLFVNRVAPGGPAAAAGLSSDDVILAVAGEPVSGMADFYRKIWALGGPGVDVSLTVLSDQGVTDLTVTAGDRYDYLRLGSSF